MSAAFKASNMVMVTPLLGSVDIAAVYHVLALSCPRSVTGETIQIVSGAREKVPYYGAPNTIVAIRHNGKSRGIRTGEGQLSNVVSIDLQCYDKNIHLKLSNGKIQLTGALSEEMGSGASQILCLHLNMAQDHIRHISELSPEIKDLTRSWVMNITKGSPIPRNEPVRHSSGTNLHQSLVKTPAEPGAGPPTYVQGILTQPPRLDDLQNLVRLHRRASSISPDSTVVRALPRVKLPSFGISKSPSRPGTLSGESAALVTDKRPNSPYKSNPHPTEVVRPLDSSVGTPPPNPLDSPIGGVVPDSEYLVNEVTPDLFERCPSNLDQRLAKFLLVHTLGCRTYMEYISRVNILLQLKFVCTPNLQPGPSKVSNAVYNYTAPITAPLPLLEITNFLHLQDLDVSYHNWNGRCIHISIPILPSSSGSSQSQGASTPQRVALSVNNIESSQVSPSRHRGDPTLASRGPLSPRSQFGTLARSESGTSSSDFDLTEDEVSVCSDDELEDSETSKDKIKIYAHRFNVYSKGTVRQSSPTTQDQAYAAYLKVMTVLSQFERVKRGTTVASKN